MKNLTLNRLFVAQALFCALALLISFLAQLVFRYQPCLLCNLQKAAFGIVGIVALFGYLSKQKRAAHLGLCLILLVALIIAGYHSLVQFGILKDFCVRHSPLSQQAFESILANPINKHTGCAAKSWVMLGLPVSFYNFLFFGVGLYSSFLFFIRNENGT